MAVFPSTEWVEAFAERINASATYRDAAATWEGAIAFVFLAEPDRGVPADVWALLDLWHGGCRSARIVGPDEGGAAPYRWELVEGTLPSGLVFDTATGALVGTPTEPGAYPLVFAVAGSAGQTVRTPFVLRVNRRLEVVRWPLTTMKRGRQAVRRMFTSGGVGAKRWKVVRGRFPVGVRMNVLTGRLTGRPRQAGRFVFTVRVTDVHGVVRKEILA